MSNPKLATDVDTQFDINESSYKTSHTAVRKARRFALQGLYEWLMTDRRFDQSGLREWKSNPPHDIAARTRAHNAMHTVHLGYYHELMRHIPEQIDSLEVLISQHLDRDINLLDPIEHAILLIGAYELKHSLHVPYKVVLDEAMKLNTHFGATDGHKLINAVLDKLAPTLRAAEVAADTKRRPVSVTKPKADMLTSKSAEQQIKMASTTSNEAADTSASKDTPDSSNKPSDKPAKPRISRKSGKSAQPISHHHAPAPDAAQTDAEQLQPHSSSTIQQALTAAGIAKAKATTSTADAPIATQSAQQADVAQGADSNDDSSDD